MNRWIKDPRGWKQSQSPGEAVIAQQDGVRLDDGDNKTSFSNGDLILTTHRLAWISKGSADLILSLSLVVLAEEESSSGFMRSEKITLHLSMPPPNPQGESAIPSSQYHFVRLAFKNGGMRPLLSKLHESLAQKMWQVMVS